MKGNNNNGVFRFYSAVVKNSNLSHFIIDGSNGSLGMDSGPNITNPYSGTNGSYYIDSNGKFYNKGGTAFTLYNSRYNNFVNWGEVITKAPGVMIMFLVKMAHRKMNLQLIISIPTLSQQLIKNGYCLLDRLVHQILFKVPESLRQNQQIGAQNS